MNVKILKSSLTNKNNSTAIRRTVLCSQLVGLTVHVSSETYFILKARDKQIYGKVQQRKWIQSVKY